MPGRANTRESWHCSRRWWARRSPGRSQNLSPRWRAPIPCPRIPPPRGQWPPATPAFVAHVISAFRQRFRATPMAKDPPAFAAAARGLPGGYLRRTVRDWPRLRRRTSGGDCFWRAAAPASPPPSCPHARFEPFVRRSRGVRVPASPHRDTFSFIPYGGTIPSLTALAGGAVSNTTDLARKASKTVSTF